jgi:peptidoglycan hydrolase CwlO-like protein
MNDAKNLVFFLAPQDKLAHSDNANSRFQQMLSSLSSQVYSFQCTVQDKDREIAVMEEHCQQLEKELQVLPLRHDFLFFVRVPRTIRL